VKIKKTGEEAVIVATDGYRLSLKRAPLPLVEGEDVVVPAKTLQEVVKISQETKESENINIKEAQGAQLCFLIGDTEIYTRVIDGEYPNFEKIIPKQHQTRCVFQKDQLLNAVKSVSIFARDSANIIKFHIENGETVLSANTPQVGKNKVTIPTEVDGEGGDIAFNSRFILEFLNHLQDEQFIFEMTGSLNSGVFKRVKDDDFLHIIMPVRTAA